MAVTARRLTADEYLAAPGEERWSELIDGEVVVNEPNVRHQRIAGYLFAVLYAWTEEAPGRGEATMPLDVRLDDRNVFAPDVLWVAEEHRPPRDARGLDGPPDLAVEVRSPSTWRHDVGAKKATYERRGLPELWLVDTGADTVLVFRRSSPSVAAFDVALELGEGKVLTSPLLPGFAVDVGVLFDR